MKTRFPGAIEISQCSRPQPIEAIVAEPLPGLPKVPAAEAMDVDSDGNTVGLF